MAKKKDIADRDYLEQSITMMQRDIRLEKVDRVSLVE